MQIDQKDFFVLCVHPKFLQASLTRLRQYSTIRHLRCIMVRSLVLELFDTVTLSWVRLVSRGIRLEGYYLVKYSFVKKATAHTELNLFNTD
jgi:hypothetical protein